MLFRSQRLIRKDEEPTDAVVMGGEIIDVDAELGLGPQEAPKNDPETENSTEICEKPANTGEIWVPEEK